MDCRCVSAAERVCDCDEGVQCPNERKPIIFIWAIYCYPCWFATPMCCPQSGTGTRSKLFSVNALPVLLGKARRHPLFLEATVKRGVQPDAGTSLAGLNNSRCCSPIGCYGISGRPFIASSNFCERLF